MTIRKQTVIQWLYFDVIAHIKVATNANKKMGFLCLHSSCELDNGFSKTISWHIELHICSLDKWPKNVWVEEENSLQCYCPTAIFQKISERIENRCGFGSFAGNKICWIVVEIFNRLMVAFGSNLIEWLTSWRREYLKLFKLLTGSFHSWYHTARSFPLPKDYSYIPRNQLSDHNRR